MRLTWSLPPASNCAKWNRQHQKRDPLWLDDRKVGESGELKNSIAPERRKQTKRPEPVCSDSVTVSI